MKAHLKRSEIPGPIYHFAHQRSTDFQKVGSQGPMGNKRSQTHCNVTGVNSSIWSPINKMVY